ncbi:hypothetical protein Esti_002376 [Eimeria stiedai]
MSGGRASGREAAAQGGARPVENEAVTEPPSPPGKQQQSSEAAASCRPAAPAAAGENVNRQSETFWRQMFEEIGGDLRLRVHSISFFHAFQRLRLVEAQQKLGRSALDASWVFRCCIFSFLSVWFYIFGYRCYVDYHYGFEAIDTNDSQLLKEVMFGGKPWIVLCKWPHKRSKIPEAVDRSRIELLKVLRLGKLDCSGRPRNVNPTLKNSEHHGGFDPRQREGPSSVDSLGVGNQEKPAVNSSLGRRCLTPGGARCLVLLRRGGISTGERNKQLQQLFGADPAVRKLKFGVLDLQKRKLNLYDAAFLDSAASSDETQLVCFLNTTPRETIEELTTLRKKDDVSRHSFVLSVFQGSFSDQEAVVDFARKCSLGKEGAEGFVKMQRAPSVTKV